MRCFACQRQMDARCWFACASLAILIAAVIVFLFFCIEEASKHSEQGATGGAAETVVLMALSRKRVAPTCLKNSDTIPPTEGYAARRLAPGDAREVFCVEPKGDDPRWNRQSVRPALNPSMPQALRRAGGAHNPTQAGSTPALATINRRCA